MSKCAYCATDLRKPKTGPMPRYCSASCRARACTARAAEDGRLAEWNETSRQRRELAKGPKAKCLNCGSELKTRHAAARYCSADACEDERNRKRAGKYVQAHRALKLAALVEIFDNAEIYERDGWVCQLCLDPIDREARFPHPLSVSLDHIVPLSKGGEHSRANTQCAHFGCNRRKGNREEATMRDLSWG